MELLRRRFLRLAGVAAAVAVLSVPLFNQSAWSQTARIIKIVVPFAPGGVTDVLARLLADQIGRAHGVTVVVENRAGAGSVIGTEAVSRAAADGNTLLLTTADFISPRQIKLNFDPVTSFEPICYLVDSPTVLAVNSAAPYRTLGSLLDAARAKPGDVTLASAGPETVLQVAFEMLKREAHVNMTFIPYSACTFA
jgi:tripartite-type tricarboxylate transporter receptor subunit TctC